MGNKNYQSYVEPLEPRRMLAADLLADIGGIYPTEAVTLDGISYFAADDGVHGKELWKSNGTHVSTEIVLDIASGPDGSGPRDLAIVNGQVVFFTVQDDDLTLWVTDGTAAGTVPLHDFGPAYSAQANIAVVDGGQRMVFTLTQNPVTDSSSFDLWTSDGTAVGTTMLQQFEDGPQAISSDVSLQAGDHFHLPTAGGKAVFTSGNQLWVSDGTLAGTINISAAVPEMAGESTLHLLDLIQFGGDVLVLWEDLPGLKVFRTDGTVGGTELIKMLGGGTTGPFNRQTEDKVYIVQVLGDSKKLWVTDGTPGGTLLLHTFQEWSPIANPASAGEKVVFNGTDAEHGHELWVSDGTVAGTHLLKDITPGAEGNFLVNFRSIGAFAYFLRLVDLDENGGGGHSQLWRTDGTADGTVMLEENVDPDGVAGLVSLRVVDNKLVIELHKSGDPTPELRVLDPDTMSVPVGPATSQMTVTDRVLRVFGTKLADSIRIYQVAGNTSRFAVNLNGVKRSFAFADVRKVLIFGYSGDDNIAFSGVNGTFVLRSMILGGSGNDSIYGGATRDSIWGEDGDDYIHTSASHDMAFGGDGDDVLMGVGGDDTLDGEAGLDSLWGGGGADFLAGGNDQGDDMLDGGSGVDVIFGQSVIEIFFNGEQGGDPLDDVLLA